jgi:type II secretion system protein C
MLALALLLAANAVPADLAAVGVVLARPADHSVAILRCEGRTRVAVVGDSVFGGRLVAVAADEVTVEFGGERVEVRVASTGSPLPPGPPPSPAVPVARAREEAPPPPRVMDRADVEHRLSTEIPRILAETAVRPVSEDGRVVGLRLTRVPANSLLTEAGLRAGDVLTRINGTEIDGMATLIGLWPRLQGATDLRAEVLRDGRPLSISLSLK